MGERGVLPASRNQTIREHLEAIRDRLDFETGEHLAQDDRCPCAICLSYEHAVAALDQMEAAKPVWLTPCMRAWHPLREEQARRHCEEHGCGEPILGRFIPDPDPGVGAEHAPKEHP